jgi:signal transduction histidine kinase
MQETRNNVVKHAHASRVDVILEKRDGTALMVIEDDGVGFDLSDREIATRGWYARAGRAHWRDVRGGIEIRAWDDGISAQSAQCGREGAFVHLYACCSPTITRQSGTGFDCSLTRSRT